MDSLDPARHSRLCRLDALPRGFLDCPVNRLDTLFEGPTLIRLRGERRPPLFVSVLLHGNEVSGLLAVQQLLKDFEHRRRPLPRDLWLFVGNIEAARYGVRRLPGQPDYNRIWAGGEHPECRLADELLDELRRQPLFAALDVHNNSGWNPLYGCVNRLEARYLRLARRFSAVMVYFTQPHEVLGVALSRLCPAATLECGLSGTAEGVSRVVHLITELLAAPALDATPPEPDFELLHTIATVRVDDADRIGLGYQLERYDLCFPDDLEALNFRRLDADTAIGWRSPNARGLCVTDNDGRNVTTHYLRYQGEFILTRRPCVLSMLTRNISVIYQDCLCYIMEPYPLHRDNAP
ncbi:M14 family metallopeptidase [Halomonas sp. BM-2019]|uniref:M14 family metallopeptidase n=1 Tax=Halomonas sp. BM-2019 TaxID=2811227 RepID=UPI001B3C2408|nr:MAG: succinylglutamate desuccinylase/aspartoacylase family protein [Halomonas sp. BM-2019]